eukprot:2610118-Rhodomonas_salina.1
MDQDPAASNSLRVNLRQHLPGPVRTRQASNTRKYAARWRLCCIFLCEPEVLAPRPFLARYAMLGTGIGSAMQCPALLYDGALPECDVRH